MKKCLSILLVITLSLLPVCFAEAESFSENPDLIEQAALSVLKLSTFDTAGDPIAAGSGFVMFDNMTLVTNYHVMEDAASMIAESDEGYQYFITGIKIANQEKDIAIMKFMAPTVMAPLEYSLDKIRRGERVTAIGSPKGLKNTVSMGNVSAVFTEDHVDWIQTTAPMSHGSSGGALFNEAGKVIGITSASRTDGQNLNFAINISEVVTLYQTWDQSVTPLGQQAELAENYVKMGDSYYNGDGVDQNYEKAVEYYTKAAKLNDAYAIMMLGECYYNGYGVEADYSTAAEFYAKASELGNKEAMCALGVCYSYGNGVSVDFEKAFALFTESAELGNDIAMCNLGLCYINGHGTKQNKQKAFELFKKAADLGHSDAMVATGNCYIYGEGVQQNTSEGISYYQRAAKLDNPRAMVSLGSSYYNGTVVNQNSNQNFIRSIQNYFAFQWFKKAADLEYSPSWYWLGLCYQNGIGIAQSDKKCFDCYTKGAELGDSTAMCQLGYCYQEGIGVIKNWKKMLEWYNQAIELGNTQAMVNLAICYLEGNGVGQDTKKAKEWLQMAADMGNTIAQQYLNDMK